MTSRHCTTAQWLIAALTMALLCAPGCSDDDPTSPSDDGLKPLDLTLVINYGPWDEFGSSGFVFASSSSGAVLATATWAGRDTVELASDEGEYEEVSITIVGGDGWKIQTIPPVPPTGEQNLQGYEYPEDSGTAWLSAQNAPPHASFSVSCNGGTAHFYHEMGEPVPVVIDGTVSDAYLRLYDAAESPLGAAWIHDLHDDDEQTLDLATPGVLEPMETRTLTVPEAVAGDELRWRIDCRYPAAAPPRLIPMDSGWSLGPDFTVSADLSATVWSSPDLHTQIVVNNSVRSGYTIVLNGPWPATIPTVDHDVTLTAMSPDSLVWVWVNDRHEAEAHWHLIGEGNDSSWITHGWGGAESRLFLPELPVEVTDALPHLIRTDYRFERLRLEREVDESLTVRVGKYYPIRDLAQP